MNWALAAGMILIVLLFGVVGWYLTLIAKFYRQKFKKGPPHAWMQASLVLLMAGLVLQLHFFAEVPEFVSALLIASGGLAFSALSYSLYRTMMSVN